MIIDSLILEVTRKCNMSCEHCLRGEAENVDIDFKVIDTLTDELNGEYISCITFTGGEPTLNVTGMKYFLKSCKDKNIEIGNFYIATNGYTISDDFFPFVIDLYLYCSENEISQISISNSIFHDLHQDSETITKLNLFKFTSMRDKLTYESNFINEGRAIENNLGKRDKKVNLFELEDNWLETLYVSATGDIISGCDFSYETVRKNNFGNILHTPLEDLIYSSVVNESDCINV